MSFRLPDLSGRSPTSNSGLNILEYELMAERADSLGRHGRKVEAALENLRDCLPEGSGATDREALLNDASDAVWAFFVQREICGLRNGREVIQRYVIPAQVLARLGASRK
ncbi:hypothetical protein LJR030_001915 [Rhizobium sp. LjRoot30]|uniref:DUF6665 family protein n=1 Tax=Rhizobium sp. LjRoot30 TaxID=3342320 RepID=UPI003ECCA2C1